MKSRSLFLALTLALPLTLPAAEAPQAAVDMSAHVMRDAAQLEWGDVPPSLEKGAQLTVLSGDPGKTGLYSLRLKMPAGYKIALHWHPTDEHVTVIEGDVTLHMNAGTSEHAHTFAPGGYVVLPARMHHAASTEGGAIVQVDGMGPFVVNYVDPEDDPSTRVPASDSE